MPDPALIALVPADGGPALLLGLPVVLLGRAEECDLRVASTKVSRLHCCLAQLGDCVLVRDLGSTNGTRVNGRRVREARLKEGDELAVGDLRFRLGWALGRGQAQDSGDEPVPLATPLPG